MDGQSDVEEIRGLVAGNNEPPKYVAIGRPTLDFAAASDQSLWENRVYLFSRACLPVSVFSS